MHRHHLRRYAQDRPGTLDDAVHKLECAVGTLLARFDLSCMLNCPSTNLGARWQVQVRKDSARAMGITGLSRQALAENLI